MSHTEHPSTHVLAATDSPPVLLVATAAAAVLALGLLIAGTIAGHMPLLAWGVVTGVLAVGLGCLVAIRSMVESAVTRSVDRTAVQVGGAIAAALSAECQTGETNVERLYS